MSKFEGKVVLITGASSGIGAALAREFARSGATLVLAARRVERLEALASELTQGSRRALVFPCDVTRDEDVEALAAFARKALGRIDVVIANAGFGVVGKVERLSLEDYRRQFETNVYGVLRTVKGFLPDLKLTKGSLGLVGSVNGFIPLPGNSPYAMSKFAVRALAEALEYELRPDRVSVTHIAPGFVASEIRQVDNTGKWHPRAKERIPVWLMVSAETAAREIVRAIAKRKREAIITGHGKIAVWVYRHFPWMLRCIIGLSKVEARPEP